MTLLLSAKPVVELLKTQLSERVVDFKKNHHRAPKLSVVLVGDHPASVIYTTKKGEMAQLLGMDHETIHLPSNSSSQEVHKTIRKLNTDPMVDGILIQRPLPSTFKDSETLLWVSPEKDVDAFHPINVGNLSLGLPCFVSCTPAGIMEILKHYKIFPSGKLACVVGRSSIVGKPVATLLLQANATVIQCHSKTPDLKALTTQADLLIVAAGKPGLLDGTFVKKGAVVIDVGIHRDATGKVSGDVVFQSAAEKASAITPVPGGVGPMTIMMLMGNTVLAAERSLS